MRPQRSPGTLQLSLACLVPPTPTRQRKPRRGDPGRRQRMEHIAATLLLYSGEFAPEEVAARFRCSKSTLYNWARLALTYDDPEAEGLRRLVVHRD